MIWLKNSNSNSFKRITSKISHRLGFTLAEVLITLGIIGVVAAMTIPNLISSYQKKATAARLKQAYSILTQTVRMAEADDNYFHMTEEDYAKISLYKHDNNGLFSKFFVPYMSGITHVVSSDTTWKHRNATNTNGILSFYSGTHCLNNGMCFAFMQGGGATWLNYTYIIVDLNGPSKPNRTGHDQFFFALHPKDSGLVIDGLVYAVTDKKTTDQIYTDNCNKTGTGWSAGAGCTEIIKRNGWQIPNDPRYPW